MLFFCIVFAGVSLAVGQEPAEPKTYTIAGLDVRGANFSDPNSVIALSGLAIGNKIDIPGQDISDAIKRLWRENIFSDIKVYQDKISGNSIFLTIEVVERARISKFSFEGINKSQGDDLREKISFIRGTILTESKKQSAKRIIRNFFVEKGFFDVKVDIKEEPDPVLKNGVVVTIDIQKGKHVKIREIKLQDATAFKTAKLVRKMKEVKPKRVWRFWSPSKFIPKKYEEAKKNLVEFYNNNGYRDAMVLSDTVYSVDKQLLQIDIKVHEGPKYFYRDIRWVGNNKYNSEQLTKVLGIYKGDSYNAQKLQTRLFSDPTNGDVSSLYLDDGYLFFNVEPVEVAVVGDSIDLELRVTEGPQAVIRKISVQGNTKTSDFVVLREIRTSPGQKFSRSDVIRSQREILALNYFNQETLKPDVKPDPQKGTVDIIYNVEERPSDQLQLQGGWGGRLVNPSTGQVIGGGFVGTVQLGFNNFAMKRFLDPKAWRPVPSGDGQRLNLAIQMNGRGYQNYSLSFMDPWFGGKKPNSLGYSTSYMVFQNWTSTGSAYRNGILTNAIDFGKRLKFPDDFFRSNTTLQYKYFDIRNPSSVFTGHFANEPNAYINSLVLRQTFDRTSIDAPIYPRSGSIVTFSMEATPPYSLFRPNADYAEMTDNQRFNLLEYHKWKFKSSWFFPIWKNLVLNAKMESGFIGMYNPRVGLSPFERFYLGGSGMVGMGMAWGLDGREIIPLRGYADNSINNNGRGNTVYNRFVAELRYPITLNQSSPMWLLAFAEAGNGYGSLRNYNPFDLKRSVGGGLRVMLPMMGLLGIDYGYGFDNTGTAQRGRFHFILGQQF